MIFKYNIFVFLFALFFPAMSMATYLIPIKSGDAQFSVYQHISENHYYDNISDDFIVFNISNRQVYKYRVEHSYDGEVHTQIFQTQPTQGEISAIQSAYNDIVGFLNWTTLDIDRKVNGSYVNGAIQLATDLNKFNEVTNLITSRVNSNFVYMLDSLLTKTLMLIVAGLPAHEEWLT